MEKTALTLHTQHRITAPYSADATQSGGRALANAALGMITRRDGGRAAQAQYDAADNMTQQLAALACLLQAKAGDAAIQAFYAQWQDDRLVIDKWFGLQIAYAAPDDTAKVTERLTRHPDFTMKNPNRFRAALGSLAGSPAGFHHASGNGYRPLADWLIRLDPLNPQTTARMCSAFETWRRYDGARQTLIKEQLERIAGQAELSRDTAEMVGRILKS